MKAPVSENKEFVQVPPGNHIARLYSIVHIGVLDGDYMGQPRQVDKIRLGFELPNELHEFKEGEEKKPIAVFDEYTFSMGEKANLRKLVHGILGVQLRDDEAAAFDIDDLIGSACMLNVIQKTSKTGKTWPKIVSAAPLPKGMEAPAAVNPPMLFDVDAWDEEKFAKLPEFVQKKIKSSYNWKRGEGRDEYMATDPLDMDEKKDPEDIDPADIPF